LSYPTNPISHAARIIRQEGFLRFFVLTYKKLISQLELYRNLLIFNLTKAPGSGVIELEDIDQSVLSPEKLSANTPLDERVMDGIHWSDHYLGERVELICRGHERFDQRRLLFVLPIKGAGGGSNSVFLAVKAMRKMGVDAQIMNLREYRKLFEKAYPNSDVPIFFGDINDIPHLANEFDAVVATSNVTVPWIAPVQKRYPQVVIGYYIQDYEAYFYPSGSDAYQSAAATYTMIPGLVRCVTTRWIDDQIRLHHQVESHLVGGHIDTDLFRPLPRPDAHTQPVRIAAMIRPSSERRSPRLTMEVLRQASQAYGDRVEFMLFGCEVHDPGFLSLPRDFSWHLGGELRPAQIANLLNQCDIFVDYSVFQGLGLTAMESLCCGLAAIVPAKGGSDTFAVNEENSLVVDTADRQACFTALQRLIEDESLRSKVQKNAVPDGLKFYPELPAYNILQALFPGEHA
jgi:glycosyltransferase involved in cell wall biosynthesis